MKWTQDNFKVSVEVKIPNREVSDHPKATPMIQYLHLAPPQNFEKWKLSVNNADSGNFKLTFTRTDGQKFVSGNIQAGEHEASLRGKIVGHYQALGTDIAVTRKMYKSNGRETPNSW